MIAQAAAHRRRGRFAKQTGHALLEHGQANGEFTFYLKKK
jgi:hypothetical protein